MFVKLLAIVLCFALWMPSPASAKSVAAAVDTDTELTSSENSESRAQLLDEEEELRLAERAEKPSDNIVGGALSNEHLTYIVIALAAAVIVLIAK